MTVERAYKEADGGIPWKIVLILLLLNILSYMDRQLLALLALPIQKTLDINDFELGLLQGLAFSIVLTLSSIPVGWAVDHMSRRRIILVGATLWSLATAASGFARGFGHLLVCRFAVAAGEATLSPSAYAILAERSAPGRLAMATGLFAVGSSLGIAAALALGGAMLGFFTRYPLSLPLVGAFEPWQATFVALGAAGLLCALVALGLPGRGPAAKMGVGEEPASWGSFFRYLKAHRTAFVTHLTGFSAIALVGYAVGGWAPAFFGRRFGMAPQDIGPSLALAIGIAGLVGTLGAAWLADFFFRRGNRAAYFDFHIGTAIVGGPLLVAAFFTDSADASLVLIGLGYTALCSVGGSCAAALQLMTPSAFRGRSAALYILSLNIFGLGLGPALVGGLTTFLFADQARLGDALAIVISGAAIVSTACLALGRSAHRKAVNQNLAQAGR